MPVFSNLADFPDMLPPKIDNYFENACVYKLDALNFNPFLLSNELTLVMFHDGTNIKQRQLFATAANTSSRPRTGFASFNCIDNELICTRQNVFSLPYFKLYIGRNPVKSHDQVTHYKELRDMVENA